MNPLNSKFSLTDNTTYTGKDTLGFYSKALLEGDTKSLLHLVADVKSKVKVARLDMANLLQHSDCTFTDGGTTTLSQKTLEVCPIKVNVEFCTRDFEVNYLSEQLKAGSLASQLPQSFQDYIMDQIARNIATDIEVNNLWTGDQSSSPVVGKCTGFLKQFSTGGDTVTVSGTTLSAANIIAEIGKVYAAIPATIVNKGKVKIFCSIAASKFYKQALAALNNALIGSYNNGDFTLSYIDIEVVASPGLPTNVMVAADPDNLWYGTDLVSDVEDIMILPMRDKTGAPTIRFVAEFKMGFQYGVGEEIVWYH